MASGTDEALRSAGSVLSGDEIEKYYKHFVTVSCQILENDMPLYLVFIC